MDYRRIPLFPTHKGELQLPVFIREISDTNYELFYVVSVNPSSLYKGDNYFTEFEIRKARLPRDDNNTCPKGLWYGGENAELNCISDFALRGFVFIDDGSFYADRLETNNMPLNARNAKELAGKELFNLSNIYAPLKVYRLKRLIEKSYSEKSATERVCRTFWDMEVLDHSKNVPCARSGHSVLVDSKNNRLFLMGGITVLADKSFQDNIEDIDNNWFYYPLNDVWKLDLETGKWERLMDLTFNPGWSLSTIPNVVSNDFKLPDLLVNVSLVCDYRNDLIYGCYSPEKCLDTVTKSKQSFLFSIDLLAQIVRLECIYNITGPSSVAISYDYERLVVQFPSEKVAAACAFPYSRMKKIICTVLDRKLLPGYRLRPFNIPYSIRFIGDNLFFIGVELSRSSDSSTYGKKMHAVANNYHLKELFK